MSDGAATDTGTVTITVSPVNQPPVAGNDTATVAEGGTLQVATSTLLANDSDPENATLSVTAVGGAVNGTCLPLRRPDHRHLRPRRLRDLHWQFHLHCQRRLRHGHGDRDHHGLTSVNAPVAGDDTATSRRRRPLEIASPPLSSPTTPTPTTLP